MSENPSACMTLAGDGESSLKTRWKDSCSGEQDCASDDGADW